MPGHCFEHCICPSGQLDAYGTPIDTSGSATEKVTSAPTTLATSSRTSAGSSGMGALVHRLEGRITAQVAAAADRPLAEHRPVGVTESSRAGPRRRQRSRAPGSVSFGRPHEPRSGATLGNRIIHKADGVRPVLANPSGTLRQ